MAPRLRIQSLQQLALHQPSTTSSLACTQCRHASLATTPAASDSHIHLDNSVSTRYSSILPPSHRDPKLRKSQLLRSYVSLLQTTPLIVLFQHNNLKAVEWASVRRELVKALEKCDDQLAAQTPESPPERLADSIKLNVIRTNIFEPALRIASYFDPETKTSREHDAGIQSERTDPSLTHALSHNAYTQSLLHKNKHPLTPLLTGNVAALTFPVVSPQHLKAALSILTPGGPTSPFVAPTRRANPLYHEPATQDGLKKLTMLGARVEGDVFDQEGVKWIGAIDGGLTGLRAQIVAMLGGVGQGLVGALQGVSRGVYLTVEGRRRMLEEEANPKVEEKTEA